LVLRPEGITQNEFENRMLKRTVGPKERKQRGHVENYTDLNEELYNL
jgi:hypothetical protein